MERFVIRTVIGFASLWVVASVVSEGVTFHLAPAIVAGAAVVMATDRPVLHMVFGMSVVVVVTGVLAAVGRMHGPSLLPFGGAVVESLVGGTVGALGGWMLRSLRGDRMSASRQSSPGGPIESR